MNFLLQSAMDTTPSLPPDDLSTAGPAPRSLRQKIVFVLVAMFVVWHPFVIVIRNPIDIWWRDIEAWGEKHAWWSTVGPYYKTVDRVTWKYENFLGVEQGWCMFRPQLARKAPFLAARLEFTDGSEELVLSLNELGTGSYFRAGGWRQRKLEDFMAYEDTATIAAHSERAVWEAYARW